LGGGFVLGRVDGFIISVSVDRSFHSGSVLQPADHADRDDCRLLDKRTEGVSRVPIAERGDKATR
jgi:hypothetical protein